MTLELDFFLFLLQLANCFVYVFDLFVSCVLKFDDSSSTVYTYIGRVLDLIQ